MWGARLLASAEEDDPSLAIFEGEFEQVARGGGIVDDNLSELRVRDRLVAKGLYPAVPRGS